MDEHLRREARSIQSLEEKLHYARNLERAGRLDAACAIYSRELHDSGAQDAYLSAGGLTQTDDELIIRAIPIEGRFYTYSFILHPGGKIHMRTGAAGRTMTRQVNYLPSRGLIGIIGHLRALHDRSVIANLLTGQIAEIFQGDYPYLGLGARVYYEPDSEPAQLFVNKTQRESDLQTMRVPDYDPLDTDTLCTYQFLPEDHDETRENADPGGVDSNKLIRYLTGTNWQELYAALEYVIGQPLGGLHLAVPHLWARTRERYPAIYVGTSRIAHVDLTPTQNQAVTVITAYETEVHP